NSTSRDSASYRPVPVRIETIISRGFETCSSVSFGRYVNAAAMIASVMDRIAALNFRSGGMVRAYTSPRRSIADRGVEGLGAGGHAAGERPGYGVGWADGGHHGIELVEAHLVRLQTEIAESGGCSAERNLDRIQQTVQLLHDLSGREVVADAAKADAVDDDR